MHLTDKMPENKLKVLDLFSGIGGFSLGLERAGMETVAFCEIEDFPRKVLAKHWPGVPIYDDVRELTGERLRQDGITTIDVLCGGFPCQDISAAGNQAGIEEGTRSGLWSECVRLLGDIRPRYAIFENVSALLSGDNGRWFQQVLWDISQVGGYDCEWHCIPASELGAHHHRDRVWIIAYPSQLQRDGGNDNARECMERGAFSELGDSCRQADLADTHSQGLQRLWQGRTLQEWGEATGHSGQGSQSPGWSWTTEPTICGVVDGISDGSYQGRVTTGVKDRSHRLKALGNAVVPQIPELIGRAIKEKSDALD